MIIYVNWREEEIYTEKEFHDAINERFFDTLNDEDKKNDELDDFLLYKKRYNVVDVFNLTPDEKEKVWSEFFSYLHDSIEDNMKNEFDKYEFK